MNAQIAGLLRRLLPRLRDVVGIDIGASGVKAVRLRADSKRHLSVAAADILPPVERAGGLVLSRNLLAWSAAMACSLPQATVKLLALPADKIEGTVFADLLGVARPPEFRVGYRVFESESRSEVPVLAVGVRSAEVEALVALLPGGKPALGSVEVSGLAALSAYLRLCVDPGQPRCDLVIDAGERITTMALCHKGRPLVFRQFPQGAAAVIEQVMKDLGVDAATARDILNIGSIDVRASLHRVYEGFLRQLGIAIDFAERRSGQRLQKLILSGGLAANSDWCTELHEQVGLLPEMLNPWAKMTLLPNALSAAAQGHEPCFAAATGAALNLMESP